MKQYLLKTAIICSWAFFFAIWDPIRGVLGFLALYCTVQVMKIQDSPAQSDSKLPGGAGWIPGILVAGLLGAVHWYGPSWFSQLSPLFLIVAAFCVSRMWLAPRLEEKPEALPACKDAAQPD